MKAIKLLEATSKKTLLQLISDNIPRQVLSELKNQYLDSGILVLLP